MWFIESDSSVLVLVTHTRFILGSSVGGTVAFMASICQIYIHGNDGHTRIPGGGQPATAKLALNCMASYVQHTATRS